MKKEILLLTILCCFICVRQAEAFFCSRAYYPAPNGLEMVTGIIQAMGRNSIDVYDELQKRSKRLIYLEQGEGFHQGDYVRVYYHPHGGIVAMIKRMTVLEYRENGQNLGDIYHVDNRRN